MRFVHGITAALVLSGLTVTGAGASALADAGPQPTSRAVVDGYQLVTLPNADVPNFQRRTLVCPRAKTPSAAAAKPRATARSSSAASPLPDGAGWIALGRQDCYNSVGISVYAICANA